MHTIRPCVLTPSPNYLSKAPSDLCTAKASYACAVLTSRDPSASLNTADHPSFFHYFHLVQRHSPFPPILLTCSFPASFVGSIFSSKFFNDGILRPRACPSPLFIYTKLPSDLTQTCGFKYFLCDVWLPKCINSNPELYACTCNCLLNICSWLCNRYLKLNISIPELLF